MNFDPQKDIAFIHMDTHNNLKEPDVSQKVASCLIEHIQCNIWIDVELDFLWQGHFFKNMLAWLQRPILALQLKG